MLTKSKQRKLLVALKAYHKQYLKKLSPELDESGTRLMVNSFLTDVLGYTPIEEVKTEYMIRGTYADYVLQLKGIRHFLVEVKSLGINLSEKHLRQAINYGANEGIEWALLTDGRQFEFYKILFEKPIKEIQVFSIDLADYSKLKSNLEHLQYIHKLSVAGKGLNLLWDKCVALAPTTIAGLLQNKPVISFLRRSLKKKFKHKFSDNEVLNALNCVVGQSIDANDVKQVSVRSRKRKRKTDLGKSKAPSNRIVLKPATGNSM